MNDPVREIRHREEKLIVAGPIRPREWRDMEREFNTRGRVLAQGARKLPPSAALTSGSTRFSPQVLVPTADGGWTEEAAALVIGRVLFPLDQFWRVAGPEPEMEYRCT